MANRRPSLGMRADRHDLDVDEDEERVRSTGHATLHSAEQLADDAPAGNRLYCPHLDGQSFVSLSCISITGLGQMIRAVPLRALSGF